MEEKNPIQVSDRLFHALEFLADHGAAGLMEVSETLQLNKSTAHRILTSLQYLGYVRQRSRDGKYELTLKLVEMSEKIMAPPGCAGDCAPAFKKADGEDGRNGTFCKTGGNRCGVH